MARTFVRGWVEDWQGRRGILKTDGTEAWFFVRAYNMDPDGQDVKVRKGEEVAFDWIYEGDKKIVSRCFRLRHTALPPQWAKEEWPPRVGPWMPSKRLGKGGNGDVWLATGDNDEEAAVKYLHRTEGDGYKRFLAEVEVMQALGAKEGILPLLSYELPDRPTLEKPAWLATPLAKPLTESPAIESLDSTVRAFSKIAAVLADLEERGIFHRDIKPSNLFWLDGAPAIGDFGLVDFPGKESVTAHNQKLGPMYYLPPEMLNEPHMSEGGPADVYTLAKSLWVIATGQRYPIPGEQRDSAYQTRLSTYIWHRRARHLDRLISQCTRHDPGARPTMSEVSKELAAWSDEASSLTPIRPRRCTERELSKVAVQLTDPNCIHLHCRQCGQGWSPNILRGGRLSRGYWRCPNGCNSE